MYYPQQREKGWYDRHRREVVVKKSIDKSRTLPDVMYYSVHSMQPANVAQSVEQLTRNEQVVGSIPTVGSEPPACMGAF